MESLQYGTDQKATYLKLTLNKMILFKTFESYQDYLMQQHRFITREGNRDFYTDSWATIECEQYLCIL